MKGIRAVIQEEETGCAIASTAVLAGVTYQEAKRVANSLDVFAEDQALWSNTDYIRRLLKYYDIKTNQNETPFNTWDELPDRALLSLNWHLEEGKPFWHWAVFAREGDDYFVLDSAMRLSNHIRTDFDAMVPKWFIEVNV